MKTWGGAHAPSAPLVPTPMCVFVCMCMYVYVCVCVHTRVHACICGINWYHQYNKTMLLTSKRQH